MRGLDPKARRRAPSSAQCSLAPYALGPTVDATERTEGAGEAGAADVGGSTGVGGAGGSGGAGGAEEAGTFLGGGDSGSEGKSDSGDAGGCTNSKAESFCLTTSKRSTPSKHSVMSFPWPSVSELA